MKFRAVTINMNIKKKLFDYLNLIVLLFRNKMVNKKFPYMYCMIY